LYDEVIARFQELTRKYSKLARMHNIGKSGEGRDLWVDGFVTPYEILRWNDEEMDGIRRDYPIVSKIKVSGGTVSDGERASKIVGHILGHIAYIARWS